MTSRQLRQVVRLIGSALVVLLLAACGGLPETGPVIDGRRLDNPIIDPIRIAPRGPFAGDDQGAIALGFVRAGADANETHTTAKSYLAPDYVDAWRWSSSDVTIYNAPQDLTAKIINDETVEVSTTPVGVLSPDGRYRDLPAGTIAKVTFGLRKVGGEWRVELPRTGFGLWLDSDAFARLYTNQAVYYVTPTGRQLVPDPRWFPNSSRLATSIARAQLGPVPDHLRDSVISGVPLNTKLAVNAVPIENGHAQINLSAEALRAGPDQRQAMWAQLSAALSQVPPVQSIGLTANDASLDLADSRSRISSPRELGYEFVPAVSVSSALLRTGENFRRISPRFIPSAVPELSRGSGVSEPSLRDGDPTTIPNGWETLALSVDGDEVAAVGGDRKELSRWPAHAAWFRVPLGPVANLSRPTYDVAGFLWVAGTDAAGTTAKLWVVSAAATDASVAPTTVTVPWLGDRRITTITIAPDGVRALVITSKPDGTDPRLDLAGVVRGPNGTPKSLAAPLRQAQPLTLVKDVVWLDPEGYAVLGRINSTEPVGPWLGRIGAGLAGIRTGTGGDQRVLTAVPRAVSITTVGGDRGIVIVTDDQRVLARAGSTWRQIDKGTDLLVPGR